MPNTYEILEGELHWVRTREPEYYSPTGKPADGKYQWKAMIRPDQESLVKVMDMLSKGVKNKLGKDETGYYINFNRPTEKKTKKGTITFEAPKVYQGDGKTELTELVGNGSKGKLKIELYEHGTPGGGKAHAARLDSVLVTELVPYESKKDKEEAQDTSGF